jgi:hypothetical protein
MYERVKNTNDWMKDYKGYTYTSNIQESLQKALFSEHSKYKQNQSLSKFLSESKSLTNRQKESLIKDLGTRVDIFEQLGKKCVVSCIDPLTKEIEDIGGSSLLRDIKTGQIVDNLILDNFGLIFDLFCGQSANTLNIKDTVGSSQAIQVYSNDAGICRGQGGMRGQFGTGVTTPDRADYKIETALIDAPENGILCASGNGYNVSNQVIYNIDANPTGGSGIVNEVGTIPSLQNTVNANKNIMITHDAVGPILYSAGKLLRAAYAWQI